MTRWKTVVPSKEPPQPSKRREKKHNLTKRAFWSVFSVVLTVALAAGALIWALPHLPQKPQTQSGANYKGIVELWNVESFEGGVGSRESWLKSRAAKFEQQNEGLFVHVTTLTVEQLQDKLAAGDRFDIVCFSRGAGEIVKDDLAPIDGETAVRDNFLPSGQLNGTQYALPLYAGAYCLFARAEMLSQEKLLGNALSQTYTRKVGKTTFTLQPLICGFTPYNSPLSALAMSGGRGNANVSESTTQYQAYEQFVANRTAVTLLGTQRDMYRLGQKESAGKIDSLVFAPLAGYTDLVQYVGVSAFAEDKASACKVFVKYLLSEQSQSTLTSLSMFSVLDKTFYTADRYAQTEAGLNSAYVPNVFGNAEAIERQRQMALDTLNV